MNKPTLSRFLNFVFVFTLGALLTACETLPSGYRASQTGSSPGVGPLAGQQWGNGLNGLNSNPVFRQSVVYLNAAVPEFDPGFPIDSRTGLTDYDEVAEQGIWPQLRRTESKKFAVKTKQALEELGVLGSVSVTPDTRVPAELFVLGRILESDSETVRVNIQVRTVDGRVLGQENFSHKVSVGVLKDRTLAEANTYDPLFKRVADYVALMLNTLNDSQRTRLQDLSSVAYATRYSPESFQEFLRFDGQVTSLVGLPAEGDPMMARIEKLKTHEYLFIDRMQEQYEAFDESTEQPYQAWQRAALGEIVRRDGAWKRRAIGIGAAVLGAALAVNANKRNTGTGDAIRNVAVAGAVVGVAAAMSANTDLKDQKRIINEMGESADLDMSPIEMEFEGQKEALQGSAQEQYTQWRAHLRKIYELERGSLERL